LVHAHQPRVHDCHYHACQYHSIEVSRCAQHRQDLNVKRSKVSG